MPDVDATAEATFRSSSFSGGGDCVEVAIGTDDVRVRDSKNRARAPLIFSRTAWEGFVAATRMGEFRSA